MTSLLPQFVIIAHKSVSCRGSMWVSCLRALMFTICLPMVPGVSILQNLCGAGWLLSIHIGLLCGIWVSHSLVAEIPEVANKKEWGILNHTRLHTLLVKAVTGLSVFMGRGDKSLVLMERGPDNLWSP